MQRLPLKMAQQKIMTRLRSGYAGIGFYSHVDNAVLPCSKCDGYDSIRDMLLDCRACDEHRTLLFEKVAAATNGRVGVTLPMLIGLHESLSNQTLRSSKDRARRSCRFNTLCF